MKLLLAAVMIAILLIDRFFLPQQARRAWRALVFIYALAFLFIFFFEKSWGLRLDPILYFCALIIVRELFISRSRHEQSAEQFTQLIRALAKKDARKISPKEN